MSEWEKGTREVTKRVSELLKQTFEKTSSQQAPPLRRGVPKVMKKIGQDEKQSEK